jgi:hypothetical protein
MPPLPPATPRRHGFCRRAAAPLCRRCRQRRAAAAITAPAAITLAAGYAAAAAIVTLRFRASFEFRPPGRHFR